MKIFIVFALCFVAANCMDKSEYSEAELVFMKKLHNTCSARTNVKDEDIVEHHKGNFCVNNISLKKYISCMWTESKILNENLEADSNLLASMFPPRVGIFLLPLYLDCFMQVRASVPPSTPLEERTFIINTCIYYRNPYEFWLF